MGFKKWLGGDKPVTQYEYNLLLLGFSVLMLFSILTDNYNSKKDRELRDQSYKTQIKWEKRIMDDINNLKIKDYCRHELGIKK